MVRFLLEWNKDLLALIRRRPVGNATTALLTEDRVPVHRHPLISCFKRCEVRNLRAKDANSLPKCCGHYSNPTDSKVHIVVTECTYCKDKFWIKEEKLFVFKKNDGKTVSHMKLQWEIVLWSGKWIKLEAFTKK